MRLREEGGLAFEVVLEVDALSLVAALSAARVKAPSEKSLLSHLLWLRELLDKKILRGLNWIDTRDMTADGHTKGCVSRDALHSLAAGTLCQQHRKQCWSSAPQLMQQKIQAASGCE